MSRKLLFVHNPLAGVKSRKKVQLPDLLKKFCEENSYDCFFYQTMGSGDHEEIAQLIRTYIPDAVIAIGGDGTVNLVGEVLVNSGIPIGIIPTGSANGLARDLNIPEKINKALEIIKEFHSHPIDTLKVNGINCFHVSDFGYNARIVRRFSESIRRGKVSYLWFGLVEFFFFEPFRYVIETGEKKVEGTAFMITVTNANRFGTNVNINPLGEIDDGYFEISIIKPFSKLRAFKILYRLFHNTIHKSKYNKVLRCKKATIYNIEDTSFHIDGEPAQLVEKIEIQIIPKGLSVLIPCCR